ncbi:MAG TPA: hypothetical protein VGH82_13570 [Gaiellaceae bacterium]|jgi:hypothetical protein
MRGWRTYEEATTELSALPSEERLQTLLAEWTSEAELLSTDDVRRLFAEVWPVSGGSVPDHLPGLVRMLHWIAPVRDVETYLAGTLTVFRAADDHRGIRWSLDEPAASAEALQNTTGMFRATIAASDVLGHFTGDGRNEVLVDPEDLGSVERVSPS